MLTLTYEQLSKQGFHAAMRTLVSTPTNNRAASRIYQIQKLINEALKRVATEYESDIIKKFGKVDEKGKVIPPNPDTAHVEGGPDDFYLADENKVKEYQEAMVEFNNRKAELDRNGLVESDLVDIKLAAGDFHWLEPILATEEEQSANKMTLKVAR